MQRRRGRAQFFTPGKERQEYIDWIHVSEREMYVATGQDGASRTTVKANRLRQANAGSSDRVVRYLRHCYAGTQKEAVLRYKQKLKITVHFKNLH